MTNEGQTAVATKEEKETALAAPGTYGEYAGAGFENTSSDDYSIPFLTVLQALSPQVSGESALDGAKAGQLFNSVTEELIDGKSGVEFVPAFRERLYIEWVPRENGGGFVGRHDSTSQIVAEAKTKSQDGKLKTEGGNDLIDTAYIYGVLLHKDGREEPAVLAFTSTKLKVYRHLMTKLNQFQVVEEIDGQPRKVTPPIFAHRLRISTVTEKNNKGTFFNFKVTSAEETLKDSLLSPGDERFQAAYKLRELVQKGAAQVNYDSQSSQEGEEEVPF